MNVVAKGKALMEDRSDHTVRNFLRITEARQLERRASAHGVSAASLLDEMLPRVRVFHMSPGAYYAAYHAAHVYTTTSLAGLPLVAPDAQSTRDWVAGLLADHQVMARVSASPHLLTEEERARALQAQRLFLAIDEGAKSETFPPHLPFPDIHVGFGMSIPLTKSEMTTALGIGYAPANEEISVTDGYLLGYSIGRTKLAGNTIIEHLETENSYSTLPRYSELHGGWVKGLSLAPWIVNALMALIVEYGSSVKLQPVTAATRYLYERSKARVVPRPFYTLLLTQPMLDSAFKKNATLGRYSFHYTYRFDVRSHERLRVQRGPLPLDEKKHHELQKRGYIIYERGATPDPILAKLDLRRIVRPRPDEWFAVLTTMITAHQKGPEDKPYVPAVRHVRRET